MSDILSDFGFQPYSEEFYIPLEFDESMFDYKDGQGVDISFLRCESYEDYFNWYAIKYPDYGENLWEMLAKNMLGIKVSRQEARDGVRKWSKEMKVEAGKMKVEYKDVELQFK
jgi:hypothetical protein